MKNTKSIILSILAAIILIGGAIYIANSKSSNQVEGGNINNVSIVDGKQIIEIKAKGGFLPRKSIAKAGIPTILRLNTAGTFDCSSSVRIPSLNISKNLPPSGTTDIDLGSPALGILNGACGMGMYPFEIDFQS
jgi:plastocyanin domain-containing protein